MTGLAPDLVTEDALVDSAGVEGFASASGKASGNGGDDDNLEQALEERSYIEKKASELADDNLFNIDMIDPDFIQSLQTDTIDDLGE